VFPTDQQLLVAISLRYTGRELMAAKIQKRLFTVDDCYKMVEAGILRPDERIELIHGEIVKMSPIGTRHAAAVDRATRTFVRLAGDNAIVRIQSTTVLDEFCAPEPDVAILRPRDDFYVHKHPAGPDILLIIEVADSSLEYDTSAKAELYAILRVHEYWVADLQNDRLLAYSDAQQDSYCTTREFHRGDTLAPQLLPDCRMSVDVLLP
jgi:Uma2 family endonuclease